MALYKFSRKVAEVITIVRMEYDFISYFHCVMHEFFGIVVFKWMKIVFGTWGSKLKDCSSFQPKNYFPS